jgi:hypothetical protein
MPEVKREIQVKGATVPFYSYEEKGYNVIEFDSSSCMIPEPMINAMLGLELLNKENMKLVMINHKSPVGLYPKIDKYFEIQEKSLTDGRVKLEIFYKKGISEYADLNDKSCHG